MASQKELAEKLGAVGDKLDKAKGEILSAIDELTKAVAAAGATSPEVDAASERLSTAAQSLDDIVPDAAPAPPAPPTE